MSTSSHRFLALATILSLLALQCPALQRCNVSPTYDVESHQREVEAFRVARRGASNFTSVEVPVVFHVIMDDEGNYAVSDGKISEQLCVLNEAFGSSSDLPDGTGFSFFLEDTLRHQSTAYSDACGLDPSSPMLSETVDPERVLNVFICKSIVGSDQDLLGVAIMPSATSGGADDVVVITKGSMPGGGTTYYNHGDTLVHEAGHYLGLYHTFYDSESCSGLGDMVDDTPMQSTPTQSGTSEVFGVAVAADLCPTGKDSCPGGGQDMVENYMDYTPDCCLDRFTPGQVDRMRIETQLFRPSLGQGYSSTGDTGDSSCSDQPTCTEDLINAASATSMPFWLIL